MKNCNYFTFKFELITCPKCFWSGQGKDLKYGEFFEDSFIADLTTAGSNPLSSDVDAILKH
jgi:hypothetical protein